jgi:hypothetical protein
MSAEQYDWVNRLGGDGGSGSTIALDNSGNVYVAGTFSGSLIIGTNQFVSAGGTDIFIAKLNPSGEPIWSMVAGGTNDHELTGHRQQHLSRHEYSHDRQAVLPIGKAVNPFI